MESDLECPYCGVGQDVCADDGFGQQEGMWHEKTCVKCGEVFVFLTRWDASYSPKKAACLNGGAHDLAGAQDAIHPNWMQCNVCSFQSGGPE